MDNMRRAQHIDVDELYVKLKLLSTWQWTQWVLLILGEIHSPFHLMSIVIIGYIPSFECNAPLRNETTDTDQCLVYNHTTNNTTPCTEWTFEGHPTSTVTADLQAVCGDKYKIFLSQTLLIVGQAVGASFFSNLADRRGRRSIMIFSEIFMLVVTLATVFVYDLWLFIFLRFLTGVAQQGMVTTNSVLRMEVVTVEHRTLSSVVLGIAFSVFQCVLALLGYLFRDQSWRHLQLFLSLSGIIVIIIHILFLDESLRWLVSKSRNKQAYRLIKKIHRVNKVHDTTVLEEMSFLLDDEVLHQEDAVRQTEPRVSLVNCKRRADKQDEANVDKSQNIDVVDDVESSPLMICKNRHMRITTILLSYTWFVASFIFFGISLLSSTFSGDRFINFFLASFIETPANVVSYFSLKYLGRKKTIGLWFMVIGVSLLISSIITMTTVTPPWLKTTLWIIGKSAAAVSFSGVFLYTPELFPTKLRTFGLGLESSAARVGGAIAPFTAYLTLVAPWFPSAVFGVCALLAVLTLIPLPETVHEELPQTIGQLDEMWDHSNRRNRHRITKQLTKYCPTPAAPGNDQDAVL